MPAVLEMRSLPACFTLHLPAGTNMLLELAVEPSLTEPSTPAVNVTGPLHSVDSGPSSSGDDVQLPNSQQPDEHKRGGSLAIINSPKHAASALICASCSGSPEDLSHHGSEVRSRSGYMPASVFGARHFRGSNQACLTPLS